MNAPVVTPLDLQLVDATNQDVPRVSVPCEARWCESDPLTVRLVFAGDGIEVEWEVSRDLLVTGLTTSIGEGDVVVSPGWRGLSKVVNLRLSSPDGCAVLQGPASPLAMFLAATEAIVPLGGEDAAVAAGVEAALARILEAA